MGERGTPRLTAREVAAVLKSHGFVLVDQRGSHQKWKNDNTGKVVILAVRPESTISLGTMRSIISSSGIPLEIWNR